MSRSSLGSSPHRFHKILFSLFTLIAISILYNLHGQKRLQDAYKNLKEGYDASFGVPVDSSPGLKGASMKVHRLDDLKSVHRPDHGTFFFGPTSFDVKIPKEFRFDPADDWDSHQRLLLNDELIDPTIESARCASYNFPYTNRTTRRRLFLGTLLADDSFEVLSAISTEIYNIFHTVSFIEANVTHNLSPREMRFFDNATLHNENVYRLYQMFGPNTKVSVDYYSSHMWGGHDLLRDFVQREGNNLRWAFNGMKPDDVAVVGDTDETFTRDFLRALQICDIPEFRPGQNCNNPGIRASTFVFESTPECLTRGRRWYHPDAMIGECVDQIGDKEKHPHTKREWPPTQDVKDHTIYHGYRNPGYGQGGDFRQYHAENKFESGHIPYPLYYATDQRMEGGRMIAKKDGSPTGYHFHNFFDSEKDIHHKYLTYGHAWNYGLKPIWDIHEDITLAHYCNRGNYTDATPFSEITGSQKPIYYVNELNRLTRNRKWGKILHDEESWWNTQKALHPQNVVVINNNNGAVEKAVLVEPDVKKEDNDDESDDDGFDDDDDSEPHPHVYTWNELKHKYQQGHGTFFFGPHSRQIEIPEDAKYTPNLTEEQRQLLDDETVDPEKEKERCANYNFGYDGRTERRRLFLGTLLADDSMDILKAVGLEMYNIFHTVSFIESNVTHNLSPREMRFYDSDKPSQNLYQLYQYFGPKTRVSVDYYSNHMQGGYDLLRDFIQREGNNFRWAFNGMKPDDVAVVGDTDETFTRDFLRALQICDIPQFKPGQDCRSPKIRASTYVFESTPECVTKNRRWYHPDAILGECVDQIGNITMHPPTKRDWPWPQNYKEGDLYHGWRLPQWGRGDDYRNYTEENKWFEEKYGHKTYPLYYATDVRMENGQMISKKDGSPTGFHFHNFFKSNTEIHNKYKTYGHADQRAWNMPIWQIHEDIALAVDCTLGKYETVFDGRKAQSENFSKLTSSELPIYFINPDNRKQRHDQWQQIIKDDEAWWDNLQNPKPKRKFVPLKNAENGNRDCAREGSQELPTPSEFVLDFEEVRKFDNAPLEKVKGFTIADYEQYMTSPPGREHYALLNYISQTYGDCRHVTDIRTRYVSSALAMASNLKTPVWTFDLPSSTERQAAFRGKSEEQWQKELHHIGVNVTFYNVDLMKVSDGDFQKYLGTWFVMLDTHHRPYTVPFEIEFFKRVVDSGYKGLMLLDDIDEHDEMRRWWKEVQDGATAGKYRTFDVSPVGHWSGTGIVDFSGKMVVRDGAKTIEPLSG